MLHERPDRRSALLEIADRMSMYATQIEECCADQATGLPHWQKLDDLLRDYKDAVNVSPNEERDE